MSSLYKNVVLSVSFFALFSQTFADEPANGDANTVPAASQSANTDVAGQQSGATETDQAEKNASNVSEQEVAEPELNKETAERPTTEQAVPPSSVSESQSQADASSQDSHRIVAIETPDEQSVSVTIDVDAPSYNHLVPVAGWNRYSGDSAGSLKEWGRWWQYLRMKTPLIMKWIDDFVVRIYPENEIFRSLFVKGIYDPNSMVVINSLLPQGGTFIDVGASFGYFSIVATKAVGANGHVIAVEPSSRDYARLVDNVKINNLGNVISTYRLALSDASGVSLLSIATEERSALNTLGKEFSFKGVDRMTKEEVDTITLDDFVAASQIKRVDVLKLDIEGSELKALHGAKRTIMRYRPAIMLGVNSNALKASGTDHDEIQKTLIELGYKAYKIVDDETFALELVPDLTKESSKIVFCLPADVTPPVLPQPERKSCIQCVMDFFTR